MIQGPTSRGAATLSLATDGDLSRRDGGRRPPWHRLLGSRLRALIGVEPQRYLALRDLVAPEIQYWRQRKLDAAGYLSTLEELNRNRDDLFVFDIRDAKVTIRAKERETAATQHLLATRVPAYLKFFEQVAHTLAPEIEISFGLLLEDLAQGHPNFPLLSFQKTGSDNLLLAPDIDSLVLKFYDSPDFVDDLSFEAKRRAAVFVGSTTGVDPLTGRSIVITRDLLDRAPPDRIRAAQRLFGQPGITFRLPGVVQCDNPETADHLRAMPFCEGGPMSWKDQFHYRFVISIDGNGATCSRMAITLKSSSVLLKYSSPYVLFYTRALTPYVHYLPVAKDEDVVAHIERLRAASPEEDRRLEQITDQARSFYRRFLGRTAQLRYGAVLLNELHGLLKGQTFDAVRRRVEMDDHPLDIMTHVSNVGDCWHWPSTKASAPVPGEVIEAFTIRLDSIECGDHDLEYQALAGDGSVGPWLPSGTLCGARGQGKALAGFRIRVSAEFAERYDLRYRATFAGEPATSWLGPGRWCTSTFRAPLQEIDLVCVPRGLHRLRRKLRSIWLGNARGD